MRRILLLITDLEIGGTPTVVRELAIRLSREGAVMVDVACLKTGGPIGRQLHARGVFVHTFSATSPFDLPAVVSELRHFIRDRCIDTVFSFLVHANVVAAAASRFASGLRWLQSIQTAQPKPRWHWVAQRVAHHAAEKVIVPSPSVARAAGRWSDVPAHKLFVIPNAVEWCETEGSERPIGRTIGFVGRLDPVKRLPDLIEALARLPAEFRLQIIGDGAERARVENSIAAYGLGKRVDLLGAKSAVDMSVFDVLVLPSEAEGFGLVLIEAMNAGVPVVATDVDGIRDVVRNEHDGLLVRVGSPVGLRDAIERVLTDEELRHRLIRNGRNTVRMSYSWPGVLRQYRQVLDLPEDAAADG